MCNRKNSCTILSHREIFYVGAHPERARRASRRVFRDPSTSPLVSLGAPLTSCRAPISGHSVRGRMRGRKNPRPLTILPYKERLMLRKYHIIEGKLVENGDENVSVFVYINPDQTEKNHLINRVQLDEHTLNSAMDPEELGRLESENGHTAIIIKRPKRYSSADNFLFKISSVGLFLFPDKIIIVMPEEAVLFDGRYFTRLLSIRDLLLKIIFRCIQHFEEHLNVVSKISDELEQEINTALTNKDLLSMFNLEKSLVFYLKAINSNGRVIERLKAATAKIGFSNEENEFLEDVIIENSQCYEEANTYSQVLSSMMDAWVSLVNNNLNIRIKTLTILSICIMLPTLIVSLFSMNVPLPIKQEGTLISFWIILGLAISSVAFILFLRRTRKW